MRVLALDYGSARCGCAVSDPTGTIVTPLDVVERPGHARAVCCGCATSCASARCERVVVGLPLSLAGEDTEQTRETRALRRRRSPRCSARRSPVELHDERFTTRMAQRMEGPFNASEDSRAAAHPARELARRPIALGSALLSRGDRSRQGPERTPEERKRDRLERERKRAQRAGTPASAEQPPAGLPPDEFGA